MFVSFGNDMHYRCWKIINFVISFYYFDILKTFLWSTVTSDREADMYILEISQQ